MTMNDSIIFEKIHIRNFLSVGDTPVELDFTTHIGMNYVYGINPELGIRNGIGKSAIFVDAILFALFGETARKINLPLVPNRSCRKKCTVRLQFRTKGSTWVVEHMMNPSSYTLHRIDPTTGEILEDKTTDKLPTLKYLRTEILNTSPDLCRLAYVMSTGSDSNLFSMKEAQRREFVDYVFTYTAIGAAYKKVNDDLNDFDRSISNEKSNYLRLSTDAEEFRKNSEKEVVEKEGKVSSLKKELLALAQKAQVKEEVPEIVEPPPVQELPPTPEPPVEKFPPLVEPPPVVDPPFVPEPMPVDFGPVPEIPQVIDHSKEIDAAKEEIRDLNKKYSDLILRSSQIEAKRATLLEVARAGEETVEKYSQILGAVCGECHAKLDDMLKVGEASTKAGAAAAGINKLDQAVEAIENSLNNQIRPRIDFLENLVAARTAESQASQKKAVEVSVKARDLEKRIARETETRKAEYVSACRTRETLVTSMVQERERKWNDAKMERERRMASAEQDRQAKWHAEKLSRERKMAEMVQERDRKIAGLKLAREKRIAEIAAARQEIISEMRQTRKILDDLVAAPLQWIPLMERKVAEADKSKMAIDSLVEEKKYLEFLKHTFSKEGVKKELVTAVISNFNQKISEYLEKMKCEYAVVFNQEFVPTFVTTQGVCSYESFSAGERRRLDMAAVFALRDLIFDQGKPRTNLLVVDECLDSALDPVGLGAIMDILRQEAETQAVFVISHRDHGDLDIGFDNVICLEKRGGQTFISSDSSSQKS